MMHPLNIAECFKCNYSVCEWWEFCRWADFIYIRGKPEKAAIAYLAGDLKT